ncbi:hypothetical protein B0H63DRAFT_278353 [Podospora didyma]|uniref:EH domain-containing protein n=1 Tax=Podospora didyma TaxID=330526 RepID=A0AAE0KGJ2_9PEZI|nr:hypothetical protein B0H63DRAFT_278353 [Podospora didyma]
MQASGTPTQRSQPRPPATSSNAALAAALKGATLAFQNNNNNNNNNPRLLDAVGGGRGLDNEALSAATHAAEGNANRQDLGRHGTGGSSQEPGSYSSKKDSEHSNHSLHSLAAPRLSQQHLTPLGTGASAGSRPGPNGGGGGGGKQTSFIAATLAASRSGSPNPNPAAAFAQAPLTATQLHSRVTRRPSLSASQFGPTLNLTDTASIQPTNSLISLFESKTDDVDPVKRREPASLPEPYAGVRPPAHASYQIQTPDSKSDSRESNIHDQIRASSQPLEPINGPGLRTGRRLSTPSPSPPHPARRAVADLVSPQPRRVIKTPQLDPPAPPARASSLAKQNMGAMPRQAPEDEGETTARRPSLSSDSSDDTFVSASSTQSPRAVSPVRDWERPGPSPKASNSPSRASPPKGLQLPPRPSFQDDSSPALPSTTRAAAGTPGTPSQGLALDSLTDAIMASTLASARLSTVPAPPPPVPPPRRHGRSHGHAHGHHQSPSPLHAVPQQRTADSWLGSHRTGGSSKSPGGSRQPVSAPRTGMLQTLRAPPTSLSDDEETRRHMHRHRKKALGGHKKHSHHEGSRRRWRDEVSARERRRYEAVWASNRGLFLKPGFAFQHPDTWRQGGPRPGPASLQPQQQQQPQEDADGDHRPSQTDLSRAWDGLEAELVVNVVVRDIWSRSRLPADELAEVWDLVDRSGSGALTKQEFVVGMWLIDQRLRGRKIPARVTQSVWESARGGAQIPTLLIEKQQHKVLPKGGGARGRAGRLNSLY